ncbi:MAG: class I SAM-dependent methyltransferase [Phormidesmis sp.]
MTDTNDHTGLQLRSLYDPAGGVKQVFSSKVTDYVTSRPDYPEPLFEQLRTAGNLQSGSLIADIGAGTGLLTQGLLQHGYRVVAVEPNAAMRNAADALLGQFSNYRSVGGAAESTPLDSSTIDLITVAQAFHWFDPEQTKLECLRVLRPEGKVALIWNDRVCSDPLQVAIEEVFAEYGGRKRALLVAHNQQRDVSSFFGAAVLAHFSYPHKHSLDEAGLVGLAFSRSYMPDRSASAGQQAVERIHQIFQQFSASERVEVRYITTVFIGRPQ